MKITVLAQALSLLSLWVFASSTAGSQERGAAGARPGERLELERRDGTRVEYLFGRGSLADPRTQEAWIVRPLPAPRLQLRPARGGIDVVLAGGDRLRGQLLGGEGEALLLEWIDGEPMRLDIVDLREIVLADNVPDGSEEPMQAPSEGDRLYVRSGGSSLDVVDGTLEEFTERGVRFDGVLGSKEFGWDRVAAVFIEVLDPGSNGAAIGGVPVVCDLVDGSRLRAELIRLDAGGCQLRVSGAREVSLGWDKLVELLVDDGSVRYLSDLPASGEDGAGSPFGDDLGLSWPHRIDRAVTGGALVAGGVAYGRGIGMHAPTSVRWELDGKWSEVRGSVAVDDGALLNPEGARGSVLFRILGDGKELWASREARGGDAPQPFRVGQLSGISRLELVVDPRGDFAGDRADWLRPLLVR